MNGQGQGAGTHRKQELFYHACVLGMRVATAKLSRFPFWLFDGNCGSGYNEAVGVDGSPIVVHLAADEAEISPARRQFFFCDHDQQRLHTLQSALGSRPVWQDRSYLIPGDNERAIEVFAECIAARENPKFAVGAIIVDPNGYFYRNRNGEGPPIAPLIEFTRRFPRIDLVMNLNMRTYHLQRGKGHDVPPPDDVLDCINRRFWLVGKISVGSSRFLVAVGRNFATGDHRRVKLFDRQSDYGREVMLWANSQRTEDLFDAPLSDLPGISPSSGVSSGADDSVAQRQSSMPLRRAGNGGSSQAISAMGHVRRPREPGADLP